jgi:raffinose/stachyose/melibiose transport system permease protein
VPETETLLEPAPARHRPRLTPRALSQVPLYAVALAVLAVIVLPLSFAVLGGFRSNGQLALRPFGLPDPWIIDNYREVAATGGFWRQTWNSTLIAGLTTAFVLPAASMAAFVIARYRFRGREAVYTLFTLGLLFPVAVAILPLFIMLRDVHLLGNPFGVALPQAAFALPLSIVILRPFFQAVPMELQDAASIDGCGPLRFYWSIMLPVSRPVLSTIAVLTIVTSWNAFFLPLLVLLTRPESFTLPIGVNNAANTQYGSDTALMLAYTSLAMVPALVFYAIAERQIVSGLTAGAVKE